MINENPVRPDGRSDLPQVSDLDICLSLPLLPLCDSRSVTPLRPLGVRKLAPNGFFLVLRMSALSRPAACAEANEERDWVMELRPRNPARE